MRYKEYLASKKWATKKEAFKKDNGGRECWVCGATKNLHVHHLTYKHAKYENVKEELRYLCAAHHEEVHELVQHSKGSNIWHATFKVRKRWEAIHGKRWGVRDLKEYARSSKRLK